MHNEQQFQCRSIRLNLSALQQIKLAFECEKVKWQCCQKKQDFVAAVLLCFFVCFFLTTSVASALSFFLSFCGVPMCTQTLIGVCVCTAVDTVKQSMNSPYIAFPFFFSQENFICILNLLCKRYITSFEQCSSNACPFAKYFHMFFHHHSSQSPGLKINSSVWWPIRPVFLMSQWPIPK